MKRDTWRIPHDDKGRDQKDTAASQGTPKFACKPPETSEKQGQVPVEFSEGHDAADALTLDFWPSEP